MYRSSRSVAAVVTVALFVSGVASIAACAMSSPADLTPTLNPDLPGLDAGSNAVPTPGTHPGTNDDAGNDSTGTSDDDGGAKSAFAGDAAGVDAEIMYSTFTPEPASEWLELYSTAASPRSLSGLTLKDGGGRTHVIGAGVIIAPGAYVILSRNKAAAVSAKVPAGAIVYEYGTGLPDNAGIVLANAATGGISLLDGATSLVSVPYGPWFSQSGGSSIQLKALGAASESTSAGWCLSLNAWTTGSEKGTPSSAADCP
jgi:hypothetical protein